MDNKKHFSDFYKSQIVKTRKLDKHFQNGISSSSRREKSPTSDKASDSYDLPARKEKACMKFRMQRIDPNLVGLTKNRTSHYNQLQ